MLLSPIITFTNSQTEKEQGKGHSRTKNMVHFSITEVVSGKWGKGNT